MQIFYYPVDHSLAFERKFIKHPDENVTVLMDFAGFLPDGNWITSADATVVNLTTGEDETATMTAEAQLVQSIQDPEAGFDGVRIPIIGGAKARQYRATVVVTLDDDTPTIYVRHIDFIVQTPRDGHL